MKKVIFGLIALFSSLGILAQGFEGTIEFKKKTAFDTLHYVYYIKADKERTDEIGSKSKKVDGSFLIDLKAGTMLSLSHERKMYLEQKPPAPTTPGGECKVEKTKSQKVILGYKCSEVTVKNSAENANITYYLAAGKFTFFNKMLKLLNRKDKFSTYYLTIPGTEGMFPVLAIMKTNDGNETERMEATKIEKKALDVKMFDVPQGYTKFDK